jgi:hypothetical protein
LWEGCVADSCVYTFGKAGDISLAGDWNGNTFTKIGVFRPGTMQWLVDKNGNGLWDGCALDGCWGPFGQFTDRPVVGDWTGNGKTKIGTYRPSINRWFIDKNGNGKWDNCTVDGCLGLFGTSEDLPVAGDWTGDGKDKIGVFRPSKGSWYADKNGNGKWDNCTLDGCWGGFGIAGDRPVAGDWTGDGKDKIGVFRPSTGRWYLDFNGNARWDGCHIDLCIGPHGATTDLPVVGIW